MSELIDEMPTLSLLSWFFSAEFSFLSPIRVNTFLSRLFLLLPSIYIPRFWETVIQLDISVLIDVFTNVLIQPVFLTQEIHERYNPVRSLLEDLTESLASIHWWCFVICLFCDYTQDNHFQGWHFIRCS